MEEYSKPELEVIRFLEGDAALQTANSDVCGEWVGHCPENCWTLEYCEHDGWS